MSWNFTALLSTYANSEWRDRISLRHGDVAWTYAQLDRRARNLAQYFAANGLATGAHVGLMMRNSDSYITTFFALCVGGYTHVNINFRYQAQELIQLLDSLDVQALVVDAEFLSVVIPCLPQLPKIKFVIANGSAEGVSNLEQAIAAGADLPAARHVPSSDDLVIIATGGTTGLPKGVMWRQEDLWKGLGISLRVDMMRLGLKQHPTDIAEHFVNVQKLASNAVLMPLSPLMHGAGLMAALLAFGQGATIVTVPGSKFDANVVLDTIRDCGVNRLALVGDAFGVPLLEALDARRDEKLFANIQLILSSGAALSAKVKQGLLSHQSNMLLADSLGSSETINFAISPQNLKPGQFMPGAGVIVIGVDGQRVAPGSEQQGMLAKGGNIPLGYYGDAKKTAELYVTLDGERYVLTGDYCIANADGTVQLLGRGSQVINTGGEKVFAEEVEQALKSHASVADALVVGLPHPRFGQMVVGVVQLRDGRPFDEGSLRDTVRSMLAGYKVPTHVVQITDMQRAANGKANYAIARAHAARVLAAAG
jgi:fatty-acyl-CoA synthase